MLPKIIQKIFMLWNIQGNTMKTTVFFHLKELSTQAHLKTDLERKTTYPRKTTFTIASM